jgi:hypothetical protein
MGSDDWCTPPEVTEKLAEFFGGPVDVDPCSNANSIVQARKTYASGGLHLPWGRTTYENPPYSATGTWTERAIAQLGSVVEELIRLTMVSTSTTWWERQCTVPRRNPRLLFTRRLAFLDPGRFVTTSAGWSMHHERDPDSQRRRDGARRNSAKFDTVLTYYGPRVRRFENCFSSLTRWKAWGR